MCFIHLRLCPHLYLIRLFAYATVAGDNTCNDTKTKKIGVERLLKKEISYRSQKRDIWFNIIQLLLMTKMITFYSILLILFAIGVILVMLAGSHGQLLLSNDDTLEYLSIAITYIVTAVVCLRSRRKTKSVSSKILIIILNTVTVSLLLIQIPLLLPVRFTVLSTIIFGLYVLGIGLGIILLIKNLVSNRSSPSYIKQE